jgi:chemotaxis protein methyltransferase CheR
MEEIAPLSDPEFLKIQQLLNQIAGIHLSAEKKHLVSGRLNKRLKHWRHRSFGEYYERLRRPEGREELQIAVDLLTTNETYFFREPKHFDFLTQQILPAHRRGGAPFRVWSAACSSGEEPYSIAMSLAATLGKNAWEVLASDLSTRVLERARSGHYALERAQHIPREHLHAYCLKGTGEKAGTFLVRRELRERMTFLQVNLNASLPEVGEFDVIFLRNVMIYFEMETKQQVVKRLLQKLRPGGYFLVGHSETLNGVTGELKAVSPAIYQKP